MAVTAAPRRHAGEPQQRAIRRALEARGLEVVMNRKGHARTMTTQKYLHALPEADDKALTAFEAVRGR